jgi:zinc transport system substrate-binding protein
MVNKMRNFMIVLLSLSLISCNSAGLKSGKETITVSISPFKYFVEAIGGGDFEVNVMVPSGADPHIYEPVPGQISSLRKSVAYISNGYLDFEMTWLDRFYEANRNMKKVSLGSNIDLIKASGEAGKKNKEGTDPHYWNSPACALIMAGTIKGLLCELYPDSSSKYEQNYLKIKNIISEIDASAKEKLSAFGGKAFMIFHPALAYFAREYGLNQIAVEEEGKEPTPSRMLRLIDKAKENKIRVIFVQKGFDTKNANAIASEIGAVVKIIDPLAEAWPESMIEIINSIHDSLAESGK